MENIINLQLEYLDENYFINLSLLSKEINRLFDNNLYKILLIKKFSSNFINNAKSIIISWKDCYNRIKKFEKILNNNNYKLWNENDYIGFWKFNKILTNN